MIKITKVEKEYGYDDVFVDKTYVYRSKELLNDYLFSIDHNMWWFSNGGYFQEAEHGWKRKKFYKTNKTIFDMIETAKNQEEFNSIPVGISAGQSIMIDFDKKSFKVVPRTMNARPVSIKK